MPPDAPVTVSAAAAVCPLSDTFCAGSVIPVEFAAHTVLATSNEEPSIRLNSPRGDANGGGQPGLSISGNVKVTPTSLASSFGHELCCEDARTPSLAYPIERLVPIATYLVKSAPVGPGSTPVSAFSHAAPATIRVTSTS